MYGLEREFNSKEIKSIQNPRNLFKRIKFTVVIESLDDRVIRPSDNLGMEASLLYTLFDIAPNFIEVDLHRLLKQKDAGRYMDGDPDMDRFEAARLKAKQNKEKWERCEWKIPISK